MVSLATSIARFAAHCLACFPMHRKPNSRHDISPVGLATVVAVILCLGAEPSPADDEFPKLYNSERDIKPAMSAEEAVKKIGMPSGFRATVFASEPDVQNPIGIAFDARGRMWVAENYTYAERSQRFDLNLRDCVIILEDADGDGKAESRKVFSDQVQMLTGLVPGNGGVWLMCPPKLLFMPDANGDDVPDGPAQEILDGFTVANENYHNFANGLKWGHDGWLYGRCGASCPGEVGIPGSEEKDRVPLRGGLWRFHPKQKVFEPLTQGTTNPWGHDWNEVGEPFFINTVNGHLWHAISGAHFVRPHSLDANTHSYELIDMHADHWHFDTGKSWTDSRDGAANEYGGGHAHIGAMIYQGDAWPAEFHGKLFTINMHGRRVNVEKLERSGGGYVGRHEPDMIHFEDPWFRGLEILYGPDGNVFVSDWSDTGECHDSNGVHRTSGRIYKLIYGDSKPASKLRPVDVSKCSESELARLHIHPNQWFVRQSRYELQSRNERGTRSPEAESALRQLAGEKNSTEQNRFDALWTLHVIGALNVSEERLLLADQNEFVRIAAIRMLSDLWPLDTTKGNRPSRSEAEIDSGLLQQLVSLAQGEKSPAVRLALASLLQRLPIALRPKLAEALVAHQADEKDHNIPLMLWYGIAPLGETDTKSLVQIAKSCRLSITRRLIARRLGEASLKKDDSLSALLAFAVSQDREFQEDILAGLSAALAGTYKATEPSGWTAFASSVAKTGNNESVEKTRQISALYGDGRSVGELKRLVRDGKADMATRLAAFESLVDIRAEGVRELCEQLLQTRYLNAVAARGLARESDAEIGPKLIKAYRNFAPLDRPAVLSILTSRPAWGRDLLAALESGQIPAVDMNASLARQLAALSDAEIDTGLARVWGRVRATPREKLELMESMKSQLTNEVLSKADVHQGQATFKKICANCHKLYGEGGVIGPDLTGAQRQNLGYLLDNIVDPSAVVTADFRVSMLLLTDGRLLSGILIEKNENRYVLQTQTEKVTVAADEVEKVQPSPNSIMPDGLLQTLSPAEVQNLFAYLMTRSRLNKE